VGVRRELRSVREKRKEVSKKFTSASVRGSDREISSETVEESEAVVVVTGASLSESSLTREGEEETREREIRLHSRSPPTITKTHQEVAGKTPAHRPPSQLVSSKHEAPESRVKRSEKEEQERKRKMLLTSGSAEVSSSL